MKLFIVLSLASLALTAPPPLDNFEQQALTVQDGFDLDLNAQRLIQLAEGQASEWVTEGRKAGPTPCPMYFIIELKALGLKFFDITDNQDLGNGIQLAASFPHPNATEKVIPILKTLSTQGPKENLEKFTSFRTRWLITVKTASASLQKLITFREFKHSWGQNSVIVRIQGSSTTDDGIVIVGAHQDSTNLWPFLPAPDDGSGSVTILESYRALLAADYRPVRTIEFHWYSAEEGGLLGSQAVAQEYAANSVSVIAMSQFDMTAWVKRGTREEAGIIIDYVDPDLTKFNMQLVDLYMDIPFVQTQCGYACSDHASWRKAGYPSTFTIESSFENSNKNIHSVNDRIDVSEEFSFEHMLEFSKLAVAFAVELGGYTD
ncbi:peptidase [Lentinula boryana]|uniref:Peptide hydrolase n=1 Tax=Lentinula boryana TaxID=40481 RepID=A0ABQ8PZX3_9AGAR|nr:peptidase [Lentinula boryana]